jgi:hypothetical protein
MSRLMPTMEQFLVGAYVQLVEGCDVVTYNADPPSRKMFWIEVVGRNEATQTIFYVDFADKFDYYPHDMRADTMVRKLVQRYAELHKQGTLFEYEPDKVRCQVWLPRPPVGRVAEALPLAVQRLQEEHGIRLEVIEPAEVARRIPAVVERARKLSFDYDNLFLRALLLAEGRLDMQAGAPMDEEHIRAMYHFPLRFASAAQIPDFLDQLLTSHEIVHWMDFYSPTFDDMAAWLGDLGPQAGLDDLRQAIVDRGEVEDEPLELDLEDEEESDVAPYHTRRYSARDLAELTRLTFEHVDALRDAAGEHGFHGDASIEIDFMLPFLCRAQERVDPSQIEREILRYGGDRDQMLAHFADAHPDKVPYRAILRIEFYDADEGQPPPPTRGQVMAVDIADPALTEHTHATLHINYAADFTGYVVLVLRRLAEEMRL